MNGAHDLGGAQNLGPLPLEADEPLFHAPWERRAFALTLALGAGGAWNIDMSRAARESLEPARYLASSYYAIWFEGLVKLLLARGIVSAGELAALEQPGASAPAVPAASVPPVPPIRVLGADRVAAVLAAGAPTARSGPAPRLAVGERVRVRLMNPAGHTRVPRYVRGREGLVERCHGPHVFPDSHARDGSEAPQVLYTIRFEARALWGEDTTADAVYVDLWESYLEPAPAASVAGR